MNTIKSIVVVAGLLLAGMLQAAEAVTGTLYKNPQCGCCTGHAEYLREHGYEIKVVESHRLAELKREQGVPPSLESCHTLIIDGYVVEGHVPVASIRKLLAERPAIRGIALPGMPQGSPGMSGTKTQPFRVMELSAGMPRIFSTE
ncbi:hypothetical protein GCM10011348_07310 [Marinobacterium nitratireducens]|uniref:CopG protein n=1 Tax=Marinobacterium nitratireducens TaxID=518897 RepID=A0A917Z7W2_9GAMM|nr:DUF411 domain-containing protein [Marinobacterium nitratireducens]GGO77536.1 hypothetical protein GCM10011348_07310 [Marinobacterium nitratireducens]